MVAGARQSLLPGLAVALVLITATGAAQTASPPAPGDAAPAPAPAAAPATPAAPESKNLEPLAPDKVMGVLGQKVDGPSGEDLGMIVNVIADKFGRPLAAVIDFGGFLGVGSRKIAVDWDLLQFAPTDQKAPIKLGLARADIQAAPEYKPDKPSTMIIGPLAPPGKPASPPAAAPNAAK